MQAERVAIPSLCPTSRDVVLGTRTHSSSTRTRSHSSSERVRYFTERVRNVSSD